MDLGLEGKVALVMAASKGLGRAVATELAREGASVVISSRDEETLARTAAEIAQETGAEVEPRAADITRAEDVQALFSHTTDRFGGLDVLVNNTGGPPAGTFDDFDDEGWQAGFELGCRIHRDAYLSNRVVRCMAPSLRGRRYRLSLPLYG